MMKALIKFTRWMFTTPGNDLRAWWVLLGLLALALGLYWIARQL